MKFEKISGSAYYDAESGLFLFIDVIFNKYTGAWEYKVKLSRDNSTLFATLDKGAAKKKLDGLVAELNERGERNDAG